MKSNDQNRDWNPANYAVRNGADAPFTVTVSGRERWALECLMSAGNNGCTPIETPGPRWSAYVFDLRAMGLNIETINEAHAGPFAGTHARYVLRSYVTRATNDEAAA